MNPAKRDLLASLLGKPVRALGLFPLGISRVIVLSLPLKNSLFEAAGLGRPPRPGMVSRYLVLT